MEKKQTHFSYGFISGIVMVVIGLILYFMGVAFKWGMQYVPYIAFLTGTILNAIAYSKANEGFVTFGNVFGSCFKMAMIVTLVMIVWSIISVYALPEMKVKAMAVIRDQMAKSPKVTDDTIDTAMKMYENYWTVMVIGIALLGNLFYGAIFSLIGGAVAKKNGERPITAGDNF